MDAVVVGSGPNGLAAAVVLAEAGLAVEVHEAAATPGGGARTSELIPGVRFDVCSAAHPMGLASPFFRQFDLAAHGVELLQPEVTYAHPLDNGRAGLAWRDLDRTVDGLGRDGRAWRRLFGPLVEHWQAFVAMAMSDFRGQLKRPDLATTIRAGVRILEQASPGWGLRFRDDVAPALLTGVSNHAILPPRSLPGAGTALLLGTLAHAVGWPIPRGGSQSITDSLVNRLTALGGKIITSHRVKELPQARIVLLDIAPAEFLRIAGDRLPARYARSLRRFRYGSGVFKMDFALSGPVPWAAPGCELAGTLHLVGSRQEAILAEREILAGRHARRPYVLATQPGVVDPSRPDVLSVYAHVPRGSSVDIGPSIVSQVERFAPGFRDLIKDQHTITAAGMADYNPNYVGGDIAAGAVTPWQMVMRPVPRWDPYATPIPGVYLCSASTPPGPGVHGMAGMHAAQRALKRFAT